jgi:hypothetical protein
VAKGIHHGLYALLARCAGLRHQTSDVGKALLAGDATRFKKFTGVVPHDA